MGDSRRDFLRLFGTAAVASACRRRAAPPEKAAAAPLTRAIVVVPEAAHGDVPRRPLGNTGVAVSILGVGGSHLGGMKDEAEALRIVDEALDAGVNFFDNAWEYHDGRSEERLGRALAGSSKRDRAFVMTKVCTHGRDAGVAMQQLEDSLRRLQTDHVDLWQIHECVYDDDPQRHFVAGGVVDALVQAKAQGKTRFVGFTGHKHPDIHLAMLAHDFPFDTVQMPLNPFDGTYRSFERRVLPEAARRGIACIGMKSLGGTGEPVVRGAITVEEALRYVWSLPVATVVSGIDGLDVLRQNLAIARKFQPMAPEVRDELRARVAPLAADGHLELYKTTVRFDAKVGREQHGYPPKEELPI